MFCYWNFLPLIIYTFNNLLRFVHSAQFSLPTTIIIIVVVFCFRFCYYCCCCSYCSNRIVSFTFASSHAQAHPPSIPVAFSCVAFFLPIIIYLFHQMGCFFWLSFAYFELTLRNLRFYVCILCHLAIVTCCARALAHIPIQKYTSQNSPTTNAIPIIRVCIHSTLLLHIFAHRHVFLLGLYAWMPNWHWAIFMCICRFGMEFFRRKQKIFPHALRTLLSLFSRSHLFISIFNHTNTFTVCKFYNICETKKELHGWMKKKRKL